MITYTLEEIQKALYVANTVFDSIRTSLEQGISSKYSSAKEFFEETGANVSAHWSIKQVKLNTFLIKEDTRYKEITNRVNKKFGKGYMEYIC